MLKYINKKSNEVKKKKLLTETGFFIVVFGWLVLFGLIAGP